MSVIAMLGYDWPTSDEEKLFQLGQEWITFGQEIGVTVGDASRVASSVWSVNSGSAVTAFQNWWSHEDSPNATLADSANGAIAAGAGLIVCAAIVLALKIQVIVQLAVLVIEIAQAIATAVATFGASLLEIPIFKIITSAVLDQLIDMATNAVLGG
ncbi:hypothetical protein [Actinoplanes sp. NPDC051851]|uniref:WXG100-like domain-containing protein n=1 Tax=Actinoplanes sp. NPDC051851 TaxID=3154753 RepID=UPI003419F5EB